MVQLQCSINSKAKMITEIVKALKLSVINV